jgi:hypothetical protein
MRLTFKEQHMNPLQQAGKNEELNKGLAEFKAEDLTAHIPAVDDLLNAPLPAAKQESSFEKLFAEKTSDVGDQWFQPEDPKEAAGGDVCSCF